ncbi:MAG: nucleotidyl transferase [Gammaproteobacteria bacterium RIFCSPHIGHO2_12_FULL_37_14]|nr:MAG: nucleotidyl transferase [Gammaproteobacteria bacterium RIFCSPHIGHO2_12_FULL_37_14]
MSIVPFSVVILAGGLATRLRPITHTMPKSLVDVNGEPFVAHQLRLLQKSGIKKVVMCVGYLGEQVVDYVEDGHRFGLSVSYSFDGPTLLGTAGSIRHAADLLDESFFVLYGDSYLPCNYAAVQSSFLVSAKKALMTVFHNHGQWDKSNIEFSDGRILAYDKRRQTAQMHYIDYGLGVFNKSVFTSSMTDGNVADLAEVYQELLSRNQLAAFEVKERFYEVGSFVGVEELAGYLA